MNGDNGLSFHNVINPVEVERHLELGQSLSLKNMEELVKVRQSLKRNATHTIALVSYKIPFVSWEPFQKFLQGSESNKTESATPYQEDV